MKVKHGSRLGSLQIAADHSRLVSRSGSALVPELAARLGLEAELSGAFAHRPQHEPGRVLVDLATMLIDGGDCWPRFCVRATPAPRRPRITSRCSTPPWRSYPTRCKTASGVDLAAWPEGTRLIVRKERPHPGAHLRFTDCDGHRYQCFITDQDEKDIAQLERRHRLHARVEDRIQESQELGLGRLPCRALAPNLAWLELALLAQDLLAWLRLLALAGDLALAKPKRLRGRLLQVAGRITRSGRRCTLHLPHAWPWAEELVAAFGRLRALEAPG